jgi:hypothetical protein
VLVGAVVVLKGLARVRRDGHDRQPEPELRPVLVEVVVRPVVGHARRDDVVEEPAPLVVVDEQRLARPLRAVGDRVHDVVHEGLGGVHVRPARVVVGAVVAEEGRVHEVHVGQVAGRRVDEELGDRAHLGEVARPVHRDERQVGEVVGAGQPGGVEAVPDRVPRVAVRVAHQRRERVGLDPAPLRGVLVVPVRIGAPEHRAEVAVEDRELARDACEGGDVLGEVVRQRVVVVAAREEPVLQLVAAGGPVVAGVRVAPPAIPRRPVLGRGAVGAVGLRVLDLQAEVEEPTAVLQPPEVGVVAAVLHHEHADVLDRAVRRVVRQRAGRHIPALAATGCLRVVRPVSVRRAPVARVGGRRPGDGGGAAQSGPAQEGSAVHAGHEHRDSPWSAAAPARETGTFGPVHPRPGRAPCRA